MADIVDNEEIDRDTVDPEILEQLFSEKYTLLTETEVSSKKSYINKLHGTKSLKLALGLSDNSIEVYELTKSSLSRVCRLSGHEKALSDVVFSPLEDHLLYSSGQDGLVKLWDTRAKGSCVQEYREEEECDALKKPYDCMDVSCNGKVLCAGSLLVQDDAYLVFWDQRMPGPLGGYWNSHTDDISQVKFHPTQAEVLASGALDGLLNIYNILETNEDDALTYSFNVENSVEKITWVDAARVSCVTQSSDVRVLDAAAGDLLHAYSRDRVARAIKRSKADDCYVVDAVGGAAPALLAGSLAGDGSVLRTVSLGERRLRARALLPGNRQLVRCCWRHHQRDLLVCAGEGGIVSVWAPPAAPAPPATAAAPAPPARRRSLHAQRHKPY